MSEEPNVGLRDAREQPDPVDVASYGGSVCHEVYKQGWQAGHETAEAEGKYLHDPQAVLDYAAAMEARAEEAETEIKRLQWLVQHHADIYAGACEDASVAEKELAETQKQLAAAHALLKQTSNAILEDYTDAGT